MGNKEKEEIYDLNFDCIYLRRCGNKNSCSILHKLYCLNEKCNFYKTHDFAQQIPIEEIDGRIYRKKEY